MDYYFYIAFKNGLSIFIEKDDVEKHHCNNYKILKIKEGDGLVSSVEPNQEIPAEFLD